jgi:predicted enzyme related to lactoylglutathione lyase
MLMITVTQLAWPILYNGRDGSVSEPADSPWPVPFVDQRSRKGAPTTPPEAGLEVTMSDQETPVAGTIGWVDLTVKDAEMVKQFYETVTGWKAEPLDMGGYSDFVMSAPSTGQSVAGICHARGINAGLPAQWLVYITVESVTTSAERCVGLGGRLIVPPKEMGSMGRYCVIQDPAGAVAALFEPSAR